MDHRAGATAIIGLGNFVENFSDERVLNGVKSDGLFSGRAFPSSPVLGLLIVNDFNRELRAADCPGHLHLSIRGHARGCRIDWRIMPNPEIGVIESPAEKRRPPRKPLGQQPDDRDPALVMVDVWKWTPMITLIVLAGAEIPAPCPYQAARNRRCQHVSDSSGTSPFP